MITFTEQTIIQRAPYTEIEIDSCGVVRVETTSGAITCGSYGMAILDLFYQPRPIGEALDLLRARAATEQEWNEMLSSITALHRAGILFDESRAPLALTTKEVSYDSAPIHLAMLNDRLRVERFLRGIREVVQPGDVVIDMGTGIGVFAIAAAQAGARHVYAIEACGIGRLAQETFAVNGFADRITLVQGWSPQLTLPERADVLISEMVGNEPTADYVLEVMMDARKRLLKPNARVVPGRVRIMGLPVTVPSTTLQHVAFTEEQAQHWSEWYRIDLRALSGAGYNILDGSYISIRPYEAKNWPVLSAPVLLADLDLLDVRQLLIDVALTVTATQSGVLNGLLVYFDIDLGPTTQFSLHPAGVPEHSFRFSPVWLLSQPREIQAGEQITMHYTYRAPNRRDGVHIEE